MKLRDILALLIALAVLLIGISLMWSGEGKMVGEILPGTAAHNGMVNYLLGIGIIMLGASVAYILLGHEEDITTTSDDVDKK